MKRNLFALLMAATIVITSPLVCAQLSSEKPDLLQEKISRGDAKSLAAIRKEAEQGGITAQQLLGAMYQQGTGVPQDHAEAIKWYQKAANQGYAEAQNELGMMYHRGLGVPQDSIEALKWLNKAAAQGLADAQNHLEEIALPKNPTLAAPWFQKAAEQDHIRAQVSLGFMYIVGESLPKDYVKAFKWLTLAKSKAQPSSADERMVNTGFEAITKIMSSQEIALAQKDAAAWRAGQRTEQEQWTKEKDIRKKAEQGRPLEQLYLGNQYRTGQGVPQNNVEAAKWYQKAAEQGVIAAQVRLAELYGLAGLYGEQASPEKDALAAMWMRRAADQGSTIAQVGLGYMYSVGQGVEKNKFEAKTWFAKAAEQGDAAGQYALGAIYNQGEGVSQNDEEAVKWLSKAAEQSIAEAQYYLGLMYSAGRGVAQDDVQAYKWLTLAKLNGKADKDTLQRIFQALKTLDKRLSATQISQAQREADMWVAAHPSQP